MDILRALFILMYLSFCMGIAHAEENDMGILVPANEFFCFDCPGVEQFGLQTYRDHYAACALNNFQLSQALGQCVIVDPEPDCFDCADGAGGCLWKPKAESNIGAVLLMPASFDDVSASIEGATVIRTVTGVNGNRKHWFFDRRGDSFGGPITVEFGNGECLYIENPAVRND